MTTTQITVANVKARQLVKRPRVLAISLVLLSACSLSALAQDAHQHDMTTQHQGQGNDPSNSANALIKIVLWGWKENPNGAFVNWHPKVSCEQFSEQKP